MKVRITKNLETPKNDQELLLKLKVGDINSFNELYNKYSVKLYYFCMKLGCCKEDAENLVQDVFFKIWLNRHQIKDDLSFQAFICTVAKNKIVDQARKNINQHAYNEYFLKRQLSSHFDLLEDLNYQEVKSLIDQCIANLPAQRKIIFSMSRLEGMSNKEIAAIMNLSLSTVENNINRAIKTIKDYINRNKFYIIFVILSFSSGNS